MAEMKRPYMYSKMDKEDPEEVLHRRAQFLIYKVLQEAADSSSRRRKPSFLRVRLCKLKVKIGKRLRKLRRSLVVGVASAARSGVYKNFVGRMKAWRRLFDAGVGATGAVRLPAPVFTLEV